MLTAQGVVHLGQQPWTITPHSPCFLHKPLTVCPPVDHDRLAGGEKPGQCADDSFPPSPGRSTRLPSNCRGLRGDNPYLSTTPDGPAVTSSRYRPLAPTQSGWDGCSDVTSRGLDAPRADIWRNGTGVERGGRCRTYTFSHRTARRRPPRSNSAARRGPRCSCLPWMCVVLPRGSGLVKLFGARSRPRQHAEVRI